MARVKKWSPIVVVWDDASTVYEQKHSDDLGDLSARRHTVGFLLISNRKEVVVCMEDDRGMDDPDSDCQTVTRIPRRMVQRIIPLVPGDLVT